MKWDVKEVGTLTADEWLVFYDFWKRLITENLPHRDLDSYTDFCKAWTVFPQPIVITCVILFRDDAMVGCARYWHEDPSSVHYEANKDLLNSDIYLLETGLKDADLIYLVNSIKSAFVKLGLSLWQLGMFQETLSQRLLNMSTEFKQVNKQAVLMLDLERLDRNVMSQWINAAPSFSVQKLDLTDDRTLEQFVDLSNKVQADIPTQETVPTLRTHDLDYWKKRIRDLGDKRQQLLAYGIHEDGELIALSTVIGRVDNPKLFEVDLTGVRADHRGKGLAKLIKAYSLLDLEARFPNFRSLLTGTNSENKPMAALNQLMGFELRGAFVLLRYR